MDSPENRDYLGKALDIAVRLLVIGIIVLGAYRIFSPFLTVVVWAIVFAIALFPLYGKICSWIGGRRKLAGAIFIVLSLTFVLVPTFLLTDSLLDATVGIIHKAREGTLQIPPPTEKVKTWPLVGKKAYAVWESAAIDLKGTTDKLQPQLRSLAERVVSQVSGLGIALVQTVIALIIAGILMIMSSGGRRVAHSVATRLAGEQGPGMVDLSIGTIRSVVKGVILVAATQAALAAVGLFIAGVPGVGLWTLLVLIVAVMQLPPIIILGPAIPWVFANNESTAIAVFFTIWSLVVSGSDGWLKPLLLGRGVKVPMLVILIGAIGGMLRAGVIGLFIGPVFLAIFYQLFLAWVSDDETPAEKVVRETATEG